MSNLIRTSLVMFLGLTIVTGVAYPIVVTGIGQTLFPEQVNGSLIKKDGKVIGSALIGQHFSDAKYFWGRPSATSPYPNNPAASSGSNLGPLNPALSEAVNARVKAQQTAANTSEPVPVDLVTTSGSGLDPEISPAAALYQVERVAKARQLDSEVVKTLLMKHVIGRQWGILGERRVNVLELNLALDEMSHT
ncbi:potassium-transporting ATPase subunit KdpC [Methylophilus sp. TWE2]|uniref:potassium-transporting ATPase subunit KdpC n=1 Tax=Methylophilus sp. TWE2 TaxID=1662285 RepID=UPI000670EF1E|nr:potassium-transporting ATPase subunit KdpC [Methylophilus sp. TWE2]AKR44236.1 potassium-transporting ATPase subunit C [Methylophilus sp. TWE2]